MLPACPQSQGTVTPSDWAPREGMGGFKGMDRHVTTILLFNLLKMQPAQPGDCSLSDAGWSKHQSQLRRSAGKTQACLESSWKRCQSHAELAREQHSSESMGCCSLRTEPSAKPWCVWRIPGVLAVPGPSHGPLAVQGEAAPGLTLIALLTIMMASCSDRSVSSMNCSAPPRRMMVQVLALGQPVKKLYLEKGGFGDGEAAAGQAVWGHSQPSSSVPLTAPAEDRKSVV